METGLGAARRPGPLPIPLVPLLLLASLQVAQAGEMRSFAVSPDRTRVSLDVQSTPLGTVLEGLARQAGFRLKLWGALETPVTERVDRVTIVDAIRELLGSHGHVLRLRPDGGSGPWRVTSLYVVGDPEPVILAPAAAEEMAEEDFGEGEDVGADGPPEELGPIPDEPAGQLGMAGRLLDADPKVAVPMLRKLVTAGKSTAVRRAAVAALAQHGGPQALRAMRFALKDEDGAVRKQAVRELARMSDASATRELIHLLRKSREPELRALAAQGLTSFPNDRGRKALEQMINDSDYRVREAVDAALQHFYGLTG
jgi:hypothetical protein